MVRRKSVSLTDDAIAALERRAREYAANVSHVVEVVSAVIDGGGALPVPWQDTLSLIVAADAGAVPADPVATSPSDAPRAMYRTRWRFR